MSLNVAVLASGGGSNLQALLDRLAGSAAARVGLVISDRPQARALERGRAAGVPTVHVPDDPSGAALLAAMHLHDVDFVALAGYLRLVPAAVIERFRGRIINVHPSLLPAFGGAGMYGLRVHTAVLTAGCRVTGVTVHHVDEHYDEGGIIAQWPVPVYRGDTAETLAARVLRVEHVMYPAVVMSIAQAGQREHEPVRALDDTAMFRLGTAQSIEAEIMASIRKEGVN